MHDIPPPSIAYIKNVIVGEACGRSAPGKSHTAKRSRQGSARVVEVTSAGPRTRYARAMELLGDPEGIQALKALHQKGGANKDFLRFLIEEAKTNIDQTARFTADDGRKFVLKFDGKTGNLDVQPAPPA